MGERESSGSGSQPPPAAARAAAAERPKAERRRPGVIYSSSRLVAAPRFHGVDSNNGREFGLGCRRSDRGVRWDVIPVSASRQGWSLRPTQRVGMLKWIMEFPTLSGCGIASPDVSAETGERVAEPRSDCPLRRRCRSDCDAAGPEESQHCWARPDALPALHETSVLIVNGSRLRTAVNTCRVLSERRRRFPKSCKTMKEAYAVRRTVPPSAEIQANIDKLLGRGMVDEPQKMLSSSPGLGARLIIQRAVEEEFDTWLGRARYERRPERQRGLRNYEAGLRNGFRPRRLQTAEGELRIEIPQAREAAGPFVSKLFPKWAFASGS